MLFDISKAFTCTSTPDQLYKAIQSALGRIFDLKNACIILCRDGKDELEPFFAETGPVAFGYYPKEMDLLGRIIIQKKKAQLFTRDEILEIIRKDSDISLEKEACKVSRTWLGAPLLIHQESIGFIAVRSQNEQNEFQKSDLNLLNTIARHITLAFERKKFEEELEDQSRMISKILESSPVGIALVQNRVFKWLNNEMVELFGCDTKEELENKSVQTIYCNARDYELAGKMIYYELASSGSAEYEIDLIKKDKTRFPAQIRLSSGDKNNPMAWTIAIIIDISQRKAMETIKAEKEKLAGVLEMAGTISREIDRPLQKIIGYLNKNKGQEGLRFEEIKDLKKHALEIGKITTKLTNITRHTAKKDSLPPLDAASPGSL